MEKYLLHRKDRLIITTIDIMNELGIQSLTTKEIAKRQGVSEATLFRHFKSKSDLLLSVLDFYAQYDSDIINSIKILKLSSKKAIMYFVESYATYYENYPAITIITQSYDVMRYDSDLSDKIKKIFINRMDFMNEMIKNAQEAHEICEKSDAENLADIITSTINGICLKWRINDYNFNLSEKISSSVNMLLDSFSN